jgi:dipeptidase E
LNNFYEKRNIFKNEKLLGYEVEGIHETTNAVEAVKNAEAIYIGGGNTFQLLKTLYDLDLIKPIQERVLKVFFLRIPE